MSKTLTVCLYIQSLCPGGSERQVALLANALSRLRVNVHIICNRLDGINGHYLGLLKGADVKTHALNDKNFAALPAFLKIHFFRLLGKLHEIAPDILHCYLDDPNCQGGCAGLYAKTPGVLLSCRNVDPKSARRAYALWARPVYKFLQRRANVRMEANSLHGAASYANWLGIPASEIAVNHNGVEPGIYATREPERRDALRRSLNIGAACPVVLYLARNVEQKCPGDMLDVAAQVRRQVPGAYFLVAGQGFEQGGAFAALVRERAVSDTVYLLGIQPETDIPDLLAAADVLLLTSRIEGIPNVAMEAMCAGLPVVATSVGGVPELVRHGEEGFLHSVGDINGMADSLVLLLENPELRQRMGEKGKDRIINNFTVDKLVERTLRQYAAMLETCSQRAT